MFETAQMTSWTSPYTGKTYEIKEVNGEFWFYLHEEFETWTSSLETNCLMEKFAALEGFIYAG